MMNDNVLYKNRDAIIAYVTSKVKKFEPDKFETHVKYYINDYCDKYLKVKFHPSIINEFYEINYTNFRDIVKDNERRQQQEWGALEDVRL